MKRVTDFIPDGADATVAPAEKVTATIGATGKAASRNSGGPNAGRLILNADDWGRSRAVTDHTKACIERGTVSSVSAMVFMEDSDRAADIARELGADVGLHLNFTLTFDTRGVPARLVQHQQRISRYLRRYRFAEAIFHPGLVHSFEIVVSAQLEEYCRLYGAEPKRLDGHHHMHLCANVLLGKLLPEGTIVRRSFSFRPGEKSWGNRFYRKIVDRKLAKRHRLTDFFFSLPPLEPVERLERIFSLGKEFAVEVETHPINPEEFRILTGGDILRWTGDVPIARSYSLPGNGCPKDSVPS